MCNDFKASILAPSFAAGHLKSGCSDIQSGSATRFSEFLAPNPEFVFLGEARIDKFEMKDTDHLQAITNVLKINNACFVDFTSVRTHASVQRVFTKLSSFTI